MLQHPLFAIYNLSRADFFARNTEGCYSLMNLPDHDRTTQTSPDQMHTITNVLKTLVGLLSGFVDLNKVICQEKALGR